MQEPLELLERAMEVLHGKYSDPCEDTGISDVKSAVESILNYLLANEAERQFHAVVAAIDKAQQEGDAAKAASLMVKRDELMRLFI